MVLINGEQTVSDGKTVKNVVDELGYNPLAIAVELNEEILPKAEYAETVCLLYTSPSPRDRG